MTQEIKWTTGDTIRLIVIALLVFLGIMTYMSAYIIGAGERGVIMDFGKVRDNTVLSPGIHFVIPVYNTIARLDVQTQVYESETMAASKDLQDAKTKIALNYHIDTSAVNVLYRDIGVDYQTRIIIPAIHEVVKASTAKYNADELITKRESVKDMIQSGLYDRLSGRGIIVEQISITNFEFSQQFSQAIEQKVTAQQNALRAENDLKRIEIEARQKIATAEGDKQSTILSAEGKAKEIEIIQKQLQTSPTYISYLATRQWDGHLPQVTGGAIPLIELPSTKTQP